MSDRDQQYQGSSPDPSASLREPTQGGSPGQAASQVAQESKEAVKQTAQETVATAKQAAQDLSQQVQQQAGDVVEQAAGQIGDTALQIKQQATTAFTDQRDKAVSGLGGLADALRQTAQSLKEAADGNDGQIPAGIAPLVEEAAERLSSSADFLREKDISGLLSEAQQLAKKQPMLFMGGMFAVGLVGARLLKSASDDGGSGGEGERASYVTDASSGFSTGHRSTGQSAGSSMTGASGSSASFGDSSISGGMSSGGSGASGLGMAGAAGGEGSYLLQSAGVSDTGGSTSSAGGTSAGGWSAGETPADQGGFSPSGTSIFDDLPAEPRGGTGSGGSISGSMGSGGMGGTGGTFSGSSAGESGAPGTGGVESPS